MIARGGLDGPQLKRKPVGQTNPCQVVIGILMITSAERLVLATQTMWPADVLAEYLGLRPEQVLELASSSNGPVDRFAVEKRMVREGQASLEMMALEFGVPTHDLFVRMTTDNPNGPPRLNFNGMDQNDRYLVPRRLVEAWVKELLPRHKVWSSLDSRARALAEVLGCDVRKCAVSTKFGETPAVVATCRCIASWDDVSRAHQESIENGKPISLEPDHVGWHTLYDNPALQDRLWRTDLTNFAVYVQDKGFSWPRG
jgi:hypothetical protein